MESRDARTNRSHLYTTKRQYAAILQQSIMVNIDLDVDGFVNLRDKFEDLEERWESEPVWAVGTNQKHGRILEFGRGPIESNGEDPLTFKIDGQWISTHRVEGHKPYPWFRPAIRDFQRDPEGFIRDTTAYDSVEAIPTVQEFVQAVATGLSNRMTDNVNAQDPSADRSPGTHPDHPKRDDGILTNDISAIRLK